MKKILTILITLCFSFGIGYFAAIDLDKNIRHRKIVDDMIKSHIVKNELVIN